MERNPLRRSGSREVSSRFLAPASPPTAAEAAHSGSRPTSPLRRKSDGHRKNRHSEDAAAAAPARGLWPSSTTTSSSRKPGTLADHLGNDRLIDLVERDNGDRSSPAGAGSQSFTRQRSYSEFARFEEKPKEEDKGRRAKENRPIGGSMRYIGKLRFPRSGKAGSPNPSLSTSSVTVAPGRISVDENALRRKADMAAEFPSSESDRSEPKIPNQRVPRNPHQESRSSDMLPTTKAPVESMMRRSNSYRSGTTQWALSPGRPLAGSPPAAQGGGRSFSSLRPSSPGKGRGVGNFISLGLDLFKRKSFGSSGSSSPSSSPSVAAGSPPRGGGLVVLGDMGHQFRLLHNRLIQWRYANARSDALNHIRMVHAENSLISASAAMSKLQASVVQKRVQLQKEKLGYKLNTLLSSQMKELEGWGDLERQHTSALSDTKDCLQSAVCRVPLVDGAKADSPSLSVELRRATDLAATIKGTFGVIAPMAQHTVPFISELAQVVTREKALLEECFELQGLVATLQLQEQSLKCHLIQMNSTMQRRQQQQRLQPDAICS